MRGLLLSTVGLLVLTNQAVAVPLRAMQDTTGRDSVVVLRPIQVSVTRAATELRNVPYSVGRVNGVDIRHGRAGVGLDESLVEIPGVAVANRYNPSLDQRISIRGFGARSAFGVRGVKVILDGIPQTLPDGQGQLSNVDLITVESIEVLRGSASSLFGNASGGVIDIRSAQPNPTSLGYWSRAIAGPFKTFGWRGGISSPLHHGTIAVNVGTLSSDGFRDHSEQNQSQASLRAEQRLSSSTSLLLLGYVSDAPTLDNPGALTQQELDTDPSQAAPRNVQLDAGKAVTQGQLGLRLRTMLANGGSVEVTGFGLTRDLDNPLTFAYVGVDRIAYGARAVANVPIKFERQAFWFTAGVDVQRMRDDRINENTDRTMVTLDQLEHVSEVGPFARFVWPIGDALTATVGGRYDRVAFDAKDRLLTDGDDSGTRSMSALSGSVGLVVHAARAFEPFANVSTSFETPTTTELVNRPTGPGGFNPELNPQKATMFEVGVRGDVSERLAFDVAGFIADVRDALIPFEVPTDPDRRFYRNAGSSTHRGIEVSATFRPIEQINFTTAYTASDYHFDEFRTDTDVFDGNRIPGVPVHSWYSSLRAEPVGGLWFAIDNTAASRMFMDDVNSVSSDGYQTTGVRVGYDYVDDGWRVSPFLTILNLFDQSYVSSAVVNGTFGRFFEPAPGRNMYAGVEIRWK